MLKACFSLLKVKSRLSYNYKQTKKRAKYSLVTFCTKKLIIYNLAK